MTDYVKSTNFASKDSLAIGNPLKIVKGTEIDTEFNNIATAVATKADINSPTFTGTPLAPTAAGGTNTTQIATTAFVTTAIAAAVAATKAALFPVGSIYTNATDSTNPATLLGFGTWVEFGSGRVLVGQNSSDALFDTLEETGGSKDAIVIAHTHTGTTGTESNGHTHTFSGTTSGGGSHSHSVLGAYFSPNSKGIAEPNSQSIMASDNTNSLSYYSTLSSGNAILSTASDHTHSYSGTTSSISATHTHSFTTASTGSSGTNANVQPYIVVKMWKRTA